MTPPYKTYVPFHDRLIEIWETEPKKCWLGLWSSTWKCACLGSRRVSDVIFHWPSEDHYAELLRRTRWQQDVALLNCRLRLGLSQVSKKLCFSMFVFLLFLFFMKRRHQYRFCLTVWYSSPVKCHCQNCVLDLLSRQALMSRSMSLFKTSVERITRIPPCTAALWCHSHSRRFHDVFLVVFAFICFQVPEVWVCFAAHFSVCERSQLHLHMWSSLERHGNSAWHTSKVHTLHGESWCNTVEPRSFGADLI